jgi:hypothetical protein
MELNLRAVAGLAVAAVISVTAAGCGSTKTSTSDASAAAFIKQVTTEFSLGQAGPLWDTLHPAEQKAVTRARYIACESNVGFEIRKIKILQTYPDTVDVAGKPTPSTAVSVRVTADDGTTTATMHAVSVDGHWRWILSPKDSTSYAAGKCPSH